MNKQLSKLSKNMIVELNHDLHNFCFYCSNYSFMFEHYTTQVIEICLQQLSKMGICPPKNQNEQNTQNINQEKIGNKEKIRKNETNRLAELAKMEQRIDIDERFYRTKLYQPHPISFIDKNVSTQAKYQPHPRLSALSSYIVEKEINDQKLTKVSQFEVKHQFHKWIGALIFKVNGGTGKGTAVLISKNLILTAAHNICSRDYIGETIKHTDFRFYLAPCGVVEQYYAIQNKCWRYPIQFETCPKKGRSMYDYAIMKLKNDYKHPSQIQFFTSFSDLPKMPNIPTERDRNLNLRISQYFFELYASWQLYQYGLTRKNTILQHQAASVKICYDLSTYSGQSGSPIVSNNNIIGIHIGCGQMDQNFNIGRLITSNLIEHLKTWYKELNGNPFSISYKNLCEHNQHLKSQEFNFKYGLLEQKNIIPLSNNIRETFDQSIFGMAYPIIDSPQNLKAQTDILNILQKSKNDKKLNISKSHLRSINVSKHINVKELFLHSNKLSSIDLSNNINLIKLRLDYNQISQIYLHNNENLKELSLHDNRLTSINLSNNTKLAQVALSKNMLSSIDIKINTKLIHLNLNSNRLTTIDIKNNTNLTYLNLHSNQITVINLNSNPKISKLYLSENYLSYITFWFWDESSLNKRFLQLGNQRQKSCEISILHRKSESKACMTLKDRLEQQFKGIKTWSGFKYQEDINKYKCKYIFATRIV